MKSPVCSHNGFDPLEEVIVGRGVPGDLPRLDFAFKLFFHDNIYGSKWTSKSWSEQKHELSNYITEKHVNEHEEDVENFVQLLLSHNITVKRPKQPQKISTVKTNLWDSKTHPALTVRDLTLIVGDKIIETPPVLRYRYFENDYLRHIFLDYFKRGAKWIQAPKPLMLDSSFDLSRISNNRNPESLKYYESQRSIDNNYMNCGIEMMFDAANCHRLGKHILFNASDENSRLGVQWLKGILGPEYTIWEIDIADNHMDSAILPIRPGLLMITIPEIISKLPPELQKWDMMVVPNATRERNRREIYTKLTSTKIYANILSIDHNTIICHPEMVKSMNQTFKKYNIDAIPCQMRHCRLFNGAHHCLTLDVRRQGQLENYFND